MFLFVFSRRDRSPVASTGYCGNRPGGWRSSTRQRRTKTRGCRYSPWELSVALGIAIASLAHSSSCADDEAGRPHDRPVDHVSSNDDIPSALATAWSSPQTLSDASSEASYVAVVPIALATRETTVPILGAPALRAKTGPCQPKNQNIAYFVLLLFYMISVTWFRLFGSFDHSSLIHCILLFWIMLLVYIVFLCYECLMMSPIRLSFEWLYTSHLNSVAKFFFFYIGLYIINRIFSSTHANIFFIIFVNLNISHEHNYLSCNYMANYFYYWTKNTAVLKIYMGFDGRDTPILTFSKSKKYLKIFSPSFNIAIKQNIISWDIYRSVSPMQKHVNCGAFGSVDKITCHMYIIFSILFFMGEIIKRIRSRADLDQTCVILN